MCLASAGWHSPWFIHVVALCLFPAYPVHSHISSLVADVTACFYSLATALNTRAHGQTYLLPATQQLHVPVCSHGPQVGGSPSLWF